MPSLPPFRLTNPYEDSIDPVIDRPKISAKISKADHEFIFRHFLAGEHGACQCILGTFWKKLIAYMTEELKLPPVWDEKNPALMSEILTKHLTFHDPDRKPAESPRAPVRRRAPRSPVVPPG